MGLPLGVEEICLVHDAPRSLVDTEDDVPIAASHYRNADGIAIMLNRYSAIMASAGLSVEETDARIQQAIEQTISLPPARLAT